MHHSSTNSVSLGGKKRKVLVWSSHIHQQNVGNLGLPTMVPWREGRRATHYPPSIWLQVYFKDGKNLFIIMDLTEMFTLHIVVPFENIQAVQLRFFTAKVDIQHIIHIYTSLILRMDHGFHKEQRLGA